MQFKTYLIDDEPLALDLLHRLLEPYSDIILVDKKLTNPKEALAAIDLNKPDLIFLDIQMPELTGFELISKLYHIPLIIFSTAYDEYALKAFETNSIDYLLKPVDPARLKKSISKLVNITEPEKDSIKSQLVKFLNNVGVTKEKRIQVSIGNKIIMLAFDEIYFFHASDKYVEVNTFDSSYLINDSLKYLESILPLDDFKRVHRSVIINLNHMKETSRDSLTSYKIIMKNKNKTILPLSLKAKSIFFFFIFQIKIFFFKQANSLI